MTHFYPEPFSLDGSTTMLLLDLLIKIFNFHINQVHPIDVLISVGRFRGIIVSYHITFPFALLLK